MEESSPNQKIEEARRLKEQEEKINQPEEEKKE